MGFDNFIKDYLSKSLISKQQVGFDQINSLIKQAYCELASCRKILKISHQVAFTCAYTAMLYAARALMLLRGYRPATKNQHKTVVEFIGAFMGADYKVLIQKFDRMRVKRNLVMYEPWEVNISRTDTEGAIKSAEEFTSLIIGFIKKEDPQHQFKF